MKKTGEILDKYMSLKMSQTDLAEIIDVSPQYINGIINGAKRPSDSFLDKFYKIFDVTLEDKHLIQEYEEFRRLPEKFQIEIMKLRNEKKDFIINNGVQIYNIEVYGNIEKNGLFRKNNSLETISFYELQGGEKRYFCIYNNTYDNGPEIHMNDVLIFEKIETILNSNEIIYFIELDNEYKVCLLEKIDNYMLIKPLNKLKNTVLLNKNDLNKLHIIGRLSRCVRSY